MKINCDFWKETTRVFEKIQVKPNEPVLTYLLTPNPSYFSSSNDHV